MEALRDGAVCQNCGIVQVLPANLWKEVVYLQGASRLVKVVCPACYLWAEQHPLLAEVRGR